MYKVWLLKNIEMFSSLKDTWLQVFVYKCTNPAKWKQTEEKKNEE